MKLFMVVAHNPSMAFRTFLGCEDTAVEFAAWLEMNGWKARIEADVNPQAQPRIKEEEEVAMALVVAFDQWRSASNVATR